MIGLAFFYLENMRLMLMNREILQNGKGALILCRVWRGIVKEAYWDFRVDDEENRMKKRSGWEFQISLKI